MECNLCKGGAAKRRHCGKIYMKHVIKQIKEEKSLSFSLYLDDDNSEGKQIQISVFRSEL